MKITITRDAGLMVVDRDARPVNVSLLPTGVELVTWDSVTQTGVMQFDEAQTEEIQERDLERESEVNAELLSENKPILQEPLYKTITIQKRPRTITDFTPFMPLWNEWETYVPPPPPPPSPEEQAMIDDQTASRAESLGAVEPRTITELKDMTRTQLRAWFDANFTTDAQLRRVVRWMFLYLIRRA